MILITLARLIAVLWRSGLRTDDTAGAPGERPTYGLAPRSPHHSRQTGALLRALKNDEILMPVQAPLHVVDNVKVFRTRVDGMLP